MEENRIGLYIHIPFCRAKCRYCDFASYAGMEDRIPSYLSALMSELSWRSKDLDGDVMSIFIGGGTPSILPGEDITRLMNEIYKSFYVENDAEITLESNPGTLSAVNLIQYRRSGINRLSIGLQAWQDTILKGLGRIHTREDFLANLQEARKAGFSNINVDLIFGLPGQTPEDWKETLRAVSGLNVEHISCYSLIIEQGTPFYNEWEKGRLQLPDEESEREMYHWAVEFLREKGYRQYEISNWAIPGKECRHNMNYWRCGSYLGLGAAASSYYRGKRFANVCGVNDYICRIDRGESPVESESVEIIDSEDEKKEFMLLGLRLIEGVDREMFRSRFNTDFTDIFQSQISKLTGEGLTELDSKGIRLTKKGLDLANLAFMEFV